MYDAIIVTHTNVIVIHALIMNDKPLRRACGSSELGMLSEDCMLCEWIVLRAC